MTPQSVVAKTSSTQDGQCDAKKMGPVDVNGGVHTARKQHQRICFQICTRKSSVDWALRAWPKKVAPCQEVPSQKQNMRFEQLVCHFPI